MVWGSSRDSSGLAFARWFAGRGALEKGEVLVKFDVRLSSEPPVERPEFLELGISSRGG
jgi:hypothetical protein